MTLPPYRKFDRNPNIQREKRRGFFSRIFKKYDSIGRSRPRNWKKFFQYMLVAWLALFFAGSIAGIGLFAWFSRDLPDPDQINKRNVAETTQIFDRTGKTILYEIHGDEKRTVVELDNISKYVKDATVAVEDKRFYTDRILDLRAILRAVWTDIRSGEKVQGGSTITRQFIKKSVLTSEKTFTRKIKELVLAYQMERHYTKDQILKLYLNQIPYGSLAYGIESAAQTFFNKSAKDLTISESAVLAALPKAPSYYSPFGSHQEELAARTRLIIDLMAEQGYISAEESEEAKKDDPLSRIVRKKEGIIAPHFVFYARELLEEEFGDQMVEKGGLKVITTLDIDKQKIAEKTITNAIKEINKWKATTAAMTAIDAKTGDILAMVGSADYFDEKINGNYNAMLGKLQPGSSIKPIVYAAAFEKGYTPDTVLYDVATAFKSYPKDYTPSNYDGKEHGPILMKEALAGSLNIPAVKTLYLTGVDRFIDFAERLGYTTLSERSRFGLSLVLGGGEVRPVEHIAAFTAFAQDGIYHAPRAILRVEDRDGKILLDSDQDNSRKVFEPEVAQQVNSIMSDNSLRAYIFGEQNYLTLGDRPVGAKTGTTNDFRDAWTIGYTPSLVAGFWVGNAKGQFMKPGADGSKVAAPLWNKFMKEALAGSTADQFSPYAPITTGKPVLDGDRSAQMKVKIDKSTGKLATEYTPPELIEERGFGTPHDILFFVDKDDPRGNIPEHPEKDAQFESWEKGVAAWAEKNHIIATAPPTESDDVHVPENFPSISFVTPENNMTVSERSPNIVINAYARRGISKVEYYVDNEIIATITRYPWGGAIPIPNRFAKGFHALSASAYDDVGNRSDAEVLINLTAEPSPLQILWTKPVNGQSLYNSQFPYDINFSIQDIQGIQKLSLALKDESGQLIQTIGTVDAPKLSNFSMLWRAYPGSGQYFIEASALYNSGSEGHETLTVNVQ